MKEIKCPHCQQVFSVDESEYAELLSQVKTDTFNEELNRRIAELQQAAQAKQAAALSQKDIEIERLKQQYAALQQNLQMQIQLATTQAEQKAHNEIQQLKERATEAIQQKNNEILRLNNQVQLNQQKAQTEVISLQAQHKLELQMKDEVIAQYKDFKAKLSTKMIGESLELYCNNQFEAMVRPYLPTAIFGKDNEVVEGTKGDFIFRDIVDGIESVSIMFEMKNEADETAIKHKNADFFRKLDNDRTKKNCEYAVLVSLLEQDNDLYNNGIYAVPGYDKMYVVRPQQFLTIISLLVQMGRNTIKVKRELADARERDIDVTHFEEKLEAFKHVFGGHVQDAAKRYNDAIKDIDKAIAQMQNMKENLRLWVDHLYKADKNFEDITIRKLTYKNPTMRAKLDEARLQNKAIDHDQYSIIEHESE